MVVALDVGRFSLHGVEFGDDRGFMFRQRFREAGECGLQFVVFGLFGQGLRPIHRKIEVAAAVVDAADFTRRRFVLVEEFAGRCVERFGEHLRLGVAGHVAEMFEGRG